jgi:cell division protein FtsN
MATEPIEPRLETTALDQSTEASTTSLFKAAIGPVGEAHYLPTFSRFEEKDRAGMAWNTAAALNTLNWMLFRQLWLPALSYTGSVVGLTLLVFGIGRLVFHFSDVAEMVALALLATLAFVIPGLFGTALFYKDCRKKMAAALAANATVSDACVALSKQASTRQRMIVIAAGNAALIGLIAATYFNAPTPGKLLDEMHASAVAGGKLTPEASPASASAPASSPASAPAYSPASGASAPASAPASAAPVASAPASASSAPLSAPSAASIAPASAPTLASSRAVAGVVQSDTNRSEAPAKPASATSTPTSVPAPVASKAKAVVKPPPKPTVAAPAQATTPSLAAGYYINVGLFAEEANAKNAHTKLLDAGLTAFVQELKTPKGKRMRVRVGPFDSEAQAESAATKVRGLQLEAVVFQQ